MLIFPFDPIKFAFNLLPLLIVSEGINTGPYCASGIDGSSAQNVPCTFPFEYQSVTYTSTCKGAGPGGAYNGAGWCPTTNIQNAGYKWGSCISCPSGQCTAFGNDYSYIDLFDESNNIASGT